MNNITLNKKQYKIVDQLKVMVPDCFVKFHKLVTEKNRYKDKPSSGESRIYIGSKNTKKFFDNYPNTAVHMGREFMATDNICFFLKSDLQRYMINARKEYTNPAQNYFYDITNKYEYCYNQLNNYPENIEFNIFNHEGKKDTARFYINSKHKIWDTFREISLPQISYLTIYKLLSNDDKIYFYFKLELNENYYNLNQANEYYNEFNKELQFNKKLKFDDIENIITNIETKVTVRTKQQDFKKNLFKTMNACPFTEIDLKTLLIASHIKPWSECKNSQEQLDGYNGLLLTPTYDKLFDNGLITFMDNGELIVSDLLPLDIVKKLELIPNKIYNIENTHDQRSKYLDYHRKHIFKKEVK